MSAIYRLLCGCKVERGVERIVEFCEEHGAQYEEIHERAMADHARTNFDALVDMPPALRLHP